MPDDAVYARKMAAHLGIRLHEIEISPDVVDMLPRIVDVLDEPIGDPAAINTVLMCEAARDAGVKVLLSGMGADELFGGYRKHLACLLGARYQGLVPSHGARARRRPRRGPAAGRRRRARAALQPLGQALPQLRRAAGGGRVPAQLHLVRPRRARRPARPGAGRSTPTPSSTRTGRCTSTAAFADHVNRMCLTDTPAVHAGLNLAYTDRSSMAASTEVRVPFVDPVVFRAAFTFPGSSKIRGRTQKVPLREAAQEWLPSDVLDRPKASFGAPLRAWVTNDLGALIDDVLLDGQLASSGFLQPAALRRMVTDQRDGRRDMSKQLWQLLSMELWYRNARAAGVGTA